MFYNLLQFPEKYKVTKKLGKERYLKFANLTPAERSEIGAYMQNAEILYAIPFEDGSEMVVLHTTLDYCEYNKYLIANYINAIAHSIPYHCLLIVQQEHTCRFYIFSARANKDNENRKVIKECFASFDFQLNDTWSYDETLLSDFRNAIKYSHSADNLNERWKDAILRQQGDMPEYNYPYSPLICRPPEIKDEDKFIVKPDIYNRKTATLRQLEEGSDTYIVEQIDVDPDNFKYHEDVSNGYVPEYDYGTAAFVDFCSDCCRTLYDEACQNDEVDEKEWMAIYLNACEQYASDCFIDNFDSSLFAVIINGFKNNQYLLNTSDYGEYTKEALKEYLWKYF